LIGADEDRFSVLDHKGRSPFPDGYFDAIYSEDVLEHVLDVTLFVAEVRRLTRPNGVGAHLYPGQWRLVESHLAMPFIQFLPRGRAQRAAILGWTLAGVEPRDWPAVEGLGRVDRARSYYRWLQLNTRYRPRTDVESAFVRAGFNVTSPRGRLLSAITHEYVQTHLGDDIARG
jgi:SAM-dependent methyltransferase